MRKFFGILGRRLVNAGWLAILAMIEVATAAPDRSVLVAGRAKVGGTEKTPVCEICIGCEGFSGGARRPIACNRYELLDGVKYRLRAKPKLHSGVCVLEPEAKPEPLAPEARLPSYPNQSELEASLACSAP